MIEVSMKKIYNKGFSVYVFICSLEKNNQFMRASIEHGDRNEKADGSAKVSESCLV